MVLRHFMGIPWYSMVFHLGKPNNKPPIFATASHEAARRVGCRSFCSDQQRTGPWQGKSKQEAIGSHRCSHFSYGSLDVFPANCPFFTNPFNPPSCWDGKIWKMKHLMISGDFLNIKWDDYDRMGSTETPIGRQLLGRSRTAKPLPLRSVKSRHSV